MLNQFGLFFNILRKFGFFKIAVVKISYWSMIWMTTFILKSSWNSFPTYNIFSRSFRWLLNQSLFPWKIFIISITISHGMLSISISIGHNDLYTLFNILKNIFKLCQIFIPEKGLFILFRCLVNDLFRFIFTMYINNLIIWGKKIETQHKLAIMIISYNNLYKLIPILVIW